MRPKHDEYENNAEFLKFQEMLQAGDRCPGTIKSYKASYKKMRNLLRLLAGERDVEERVDELGAGLAVG